MRQLSENEAEKAGEKIDTSLSLPWLVSDWLNQGGASARLSEVKNESRRDFTPTPPLIGSVPIECACGEVLSCATLLTLAHF